MNVTWDKFCPLAWLSLHSPSTMWCPAQYCKASSQNPPAERLMLGADPAVGASPWSLCLGCFTVPDMHPPTALFQLPLPRCMGRCHRLWPWLNSACHYRMSGGGWGRSVQVLLSRLEKVGYCFCLATRRGGDGWGWRRTREEPCTDTL